MVNEPLQEDVYTYIKMYDKLIWWFPVKKKLLQKTGKN